jgi:hypothetical protein
MRRSIAVAAVLAAAPSLALLAPAAHAAAPVTKLTASASCHGGGTVRMTSSVDAAGTGAVHVKVGGVKQKRWRGDLLLGLDNPETGEGTSFDDTAPVFQTYHAKHGSFTASAEQPNAGGLSAIASFYSKRDAVCLVATLTHGSTVAAEGVAGVLFVGGRKQALKAFTFGEPGDRYRVALSAKTKAGVKRWTFVRRATGEDGLGVIRVQVRGVKHLPSLKWAAMTVTDLTTPGEPLKVKLIS